MRILSHPSGGAPSDVPYEYDRLRRRFPFTGAKLYRNLAHILSERLRDTTARLTAPAP